MGVLYIRNKTTGKFEAVKSLQGLPGKDGTMTFEDLTDEQRESLRGPEGKQGNTGERGETGATPVFSFEVETGAAGTPVSVEQSGTPENPVVKLTIPRGDTGAVEGVDYYEGTAMPLGQASPGTANGLSRGDHVHPMPSAKDIGALGHNDTAVNSDKLGNREASDYLLKEEAVVNPVQSVTANNVKYTPDRNGNVNLGTIGGSGSGNGTVKSVNDIQPDDLGNIEFHMSDIMPDQEEESVEEDNVVLPVKAEDSDKLGGKAPEYYLQPVNLINNSEFTIRGNGALTDACWNCGGEATLTIDKDGVKTFTSINGYNSIRQSIFTDGREVGKPYTLAITLEDGTRLVRSDIAPEPDGKNQIVTCDIIIDSSTEIFTITEPNGEYAVRLNAKSAGASIRFKDIDLFEGTYTAETVPPHSPKGYANELLACEVAEKGSIFAWKGIGRSYGEAVSVPECDEVMLYVTATDKTTYAFNSVILPYSAFDDSYIPMRMFIRGGNATITCANGKVTLTSVSMDGVDVTATSNVLVYAR